MYRVERMNKKALLVGINYVGDKKELKGCINDIYNIKTLITTRYNYKNDNIRILQDCNQDVKDKSPILADKLPTRTNIINGLKWLVNGARFGDSLLFAYSGHGTTRADLNDEEADYNDEGICPIKDPNNVIAANIDNVIIDDELKVLLVDPLKYGVKLTILLDACHSATCVDLKYNYGHCNTMTIRMNDPDVLLSGKVILIAGCDDHATSSNAVFIEETADGTAKQEINEGACTHALLMALSKKNSPSIGELLNDMRKYLKANKYTQIPQLSSNKQLNLKDKFIL